MFNDDLPDDVVIVNINPLERDEVPKTPQQIQNRINEISFNSSLFRELRAISFVQRLLDEGKLKAGEMSRVLVHMIADNELMNSLSVATKTVPNPVVLHKLKEAGRAAADRFLSRSQRRSGQPQHRRSARNVRLIIRAAGSGLCRWDRPDPAEITSLAASSMDMSSRITSSAGKNSRKPDVGLGVVGT